jgi:hypothetical protein
MNIGKDAKSLMIGKKAIITSLFKQGARLTCENYGGLSLLNTSYKVYSKILSNRLKVIADKLLLEEQSGFREGRSSIDDVSH